MTPPTAAAQQRAFRAKHAPAETPKIGIWLRKGDAFCLAAGVIPDSLRQLAVEAIAEFWTDEKDDEEPVSRSPSTATTHGAGSTARATR